MQQQSNHLNFCLGLNDLSVYNETDEIRPSNPFLHNQGKENSVLDIALQVMATVTARKAPREFTCTLEKKSLF